MSHLTSVIRKPILLFFMISFGMFGSRLCAESVEHAPGCLNALVPKSKGITSGRSVNPWRPKSTGAIKSATKPITVHFQDGNSQEYVHKILASAELAWSVEIEKMGFRKPVSDGDLGGDGNLDFYVVDNLSPGIGGYTGFSGYGDDENLTGIPYILVSHVLTDRYLRGVVAHEFFHAIQMAYNWWENMAFMEGTATWVVNYVVPDEGFYWHYFPYYNKYPQRSLDFVDTQSPYQYGTALWYTYLDERFSKSPGEVIRKIWEETAAHPDGVRSNYFRAMTAVLHGIEGLRSAFIEFGDSQILLGPRDDGKHFRNGGTWDNSVTPYVDVQLNAGIEHAEGRTSVGVEPFGRAYMTLAHNPSAPVKMTIALQGEAGADYQFRLLSRSGKKVELLASEQVHGSTTIQFPVTSDIPTEEVILSVTNLGTADLDLDYGDKIARIVRFKIDNQ